VQSLCTLAQQLVHAVHPQLKDRPEPRVPPPHHHHVHFAPLVGEGVGSGGKVLKGLREPAMAHACGDFVHCPLVRVDNMGVQCMARHDPETLVHGVGTPCLKRLVHLAQPPHSVRAVRPLCTLAQQLVHGVHPQLKGRPEPRVPPARHHHLQSAALVGVGVGRASEAPKGLREPAMAGRNYEKSVA